MPKNKRVVIAHFKGLTLKPCERVGNAIVIPWVSPEQEYYIDTDCVKALFDLINKTFSSDSSEISTVVAGLLQRFNYYSKRFDQSSSVEADEASCRAMALGFNWYARNKKIIKRLGSPFAQCNKMFWQQVVFNEQHKMARLIIDKAYSEDARFRECFRETANVFLKSRRRRDGIKIDEDTFLYNSQEYLKEECAFLCSLLASYSKEIAQGKKIYIVYPSGGTPAIKATLELIQRENPDKICWLSAELKTCDAEAFDLQAFLAVSPHNGCSKNVEKLMQSKYKGKHKTKGGDFELLHQAVATPQRLSSLIALVQKKKSQVDKEWVDIIQKSIPIILGGSSPPKEDMCSLWSSFFTRARELSALSDSSSSAASSSQSSSTTSLEDEGEAACSSTSDIIRSKLQ